MTVRDDQTPCGMTVAQVIACGGGWTVVGRACKVSAQSVIKWKKIPDRHVDVVLALTGLPLWVVRPDLAKLRSMCVRARLSPKEKGKIVQRKPNRRKHDQYSKV